MKVSVVGLGYVGSVAAAGLAAGGHEVVGIDVDWARIDTYRRGQMPFYEPDLSDLINAGLQSRNLRFLHTDEVLEPLGEVIVIATGTPAAESGGVDLSYVKSALSWVNERHPEGGVILMKSTIPPGTGALLIETILRDSRVGYVSNPEFLREGRAVRDWFSPDRIVLGTNDERVVQVVRALYEGIEAPYVVTDVTSAELIKYAANAFLATKISFINEIAMLCDSVGATIDAVAEGISLDPRIGSSFLNAGVGYGGSCFPKDTRALDDLALHNGHSFELLRSVISVNNRQRLLPLYALRERLGRLRGVTVGVLGLAFKPHTDDVRDSPAIDLARALVQEEVLVNAYDPKVSAGSVPGWLTLATDPIDCAEGAQALVLMTEWEEIVEADWEAMADAAVAPKLLFDGRNALDPIRMQRLGFEYIGVGRNGTNCSFHQ